MTYYDPAMGAPVQAALDALVADWSEVTERVMFGCPSYLAAGTPFAVLVTGGLALTRLPDAARTDLETDFETCPFQAGDRTISRWVQVTVDDPATVADLEPFVRASYETALVQ